MPRVRELTFDTLKVKISPLSWDEAEKYIAEGKEMLEREPKVSIDDWADRTVQSVALAMNKGAGTTDWTPVKVKTEMDMVTIQEIYNEFMKMSGLMARTATPGEVQATSTLP